MSVLVAPDQAVSVTRPPAASMYIYATEMVRHYYQRVGLEGQRVLTVAGSGDQVLNAYLMGARDVTGFDLSTKALLMTRLKIAAVRTCSYQEFLDFFGAERVNVGFAFSLYAKIREALDPVTRHFFDWLYRAHGFRGERLVRSSYFHQRPYFSTTPRAVNAYLDDTFAYLRLRHVLEAIDCRLIRSDVRRLVRRKAFTQKPFDVINLSNVPDYLWLERGGRGGGLNEVINILRGLRGILAPGGRIFYYVYSPRRYPNVVFDERPPLARLTQLRRLSVDSSFDMAECRFRGFLQRGFDKVVVLQRRPTRRFAIADRRRV